jgi:hypothetical protein
MSVLVSRDEIAPGDERWHVSAAHTDRVPSWDELVEAAHELRPGVFFVVNVPPQNLWMSLHPHVLHLWEMKDAAMEAQMRAEARGTRESQQPRRR